MSQLPSFEVTADTTKNILRTHLRGQVDLATMTAYVDKVATLLPSLRAGFTVFTDLSGILSMDTASVPQVERLMDLCRDKGVATVVRVIPKRSKDVGFNILSIFHYPKKVRIITYPTLAEAERTLA